MSKCGGNILQRNWDWCLYTMSGHNGRLYRRGEWPWGLGTEQAKPQSLLCCQMKWWLRSLLSYQESSPHFSRRMNWNAPLWIESQRLRYLHRVKTAWLGTLGNCLFKGSCGGLDQFSWGIVQSGLHTMKNPWTVVWLEKGSWVTIWAKPPLGLNLGSGTEARETGSFGCSPNSTL